VRPERRRPPVLFVHGAGGGGWEWNRWLPLFRAEGFDCVAPDLQPADGGLAATRIEHYVSQLQGRVAGLPPPILIGASLGGLLCLLLAERMATSALVLLNALPPAPEAAGLPPRDAWPTVVPWASAARFGSTVSSMGDADEASRLYAFRRWRDESGAVLQAACDGLPCRLPDVPTLVIASDHDAEVPAAVSANLARRLGGSLLRHPGDHLAPLLGRTANRVAAQTVAWLNATFEFTRD